MAKAPPNDTKVNVEQDEEYENKPLPEGVTPGLREDDVPPEAQRKIRMMVLARGRSQKLSNAQRQLREEGTYSWRVSDYLERVPGSEVVEAHQAALDCVMEPPKSWQQKIDREMTNKLHEEKVKRVAAETEVSTAAKMMTRIEERLDKRDQAGEKKDAEMLTLISNLAQKVALIGHSGSTEKPQAKDDV